MPLRIIQQEPGAQGRQGEGQTGPCPAGASSEANRWSDRHHTDGRQIATTPTLPPTQPPLHPNPCHHSPPPPRPPRHTSPRPIPSRRTVPHTAALSPHNPTCPGIPGSIYVDEGGAADPGSPSDTVLLGQILSSSSPDVDALAGMSVRQLKVELQRQGIAHEHCIEKSELMALLASSQIPSSDAAPPLI